MTDMKLSRRTIAALGAVPVIVVGGFVVLENNTATAAPSPSQVGPVDPAVLAQLAKNGQLGVGQFKAGAASMVNTTNASTNEVAAAGPVGQSQAISSAEDALGFNGANVKGASLITITTNSVGWRQSDGSFRPQYAGTAAWAVQIGDVQIPVGAAHGSAATQPGASATDAPRATYTADMVVFVDAYTGAFLYGDQYIP